MKDLYLKLILSLSALLLMVLRIIQPGLQIDAITIGLAVFAALPWLPSILESAELPGGWKVKFREIEEKQEQQQADISTLKFLVSHFVTDHEFRHLQSLAGDEPFIFTRDSTSSFFEQELRRLRALDLIAGYPNKGVRSLFKEEGDVKKHFYVTEQGLAYLKLRQEVGSSENT